MCVNLAWSLQFGCHTRLKNFTDEIVCIPMGTKCAPHDGGLPLFCYERAFIVSLNLGVCVCGGGGGGGGGGEGGGNLI